MSLTRQQILDSARPRPVEIPEFGGEVYIRPLSLVSYLNISKAENEAVDVTLDVVIECACDEAGAPLFTAADKDILLRANPSGLEKIAAEAIKASGLGVESVDAAAKNSEQTPDGSSL